MAISEASLVDAALMAIAEINQSGGVLNQFIEPVIEDAASNPTLFESKARKLIQCDRVATIFGCWTSASRKAVLPVLEQFNALLWYPVQYEGLEGSRNIFYTGSCPNQQVEPAVYWLLSNKGKRFYLIGSDYVFPRTAGKIIKAQLKQHQGTVVGEEYVSLEKTDFTEIISRIKQSKPDVIFNTLNGESNVDFYRQYQESGITADRIPIMTCTVSEVELQQIGEAAIGHYACWSYFQSLDTPENRKFVENFQRSYGSNSDSETLTFEDTYGEQKPLQKRSENRVTSDPIEAAYTQVYLWKQAVEQAQSFDVDRVRVAAYGQNFEAPGGLVRIEPNHHVRRACRIGRVLPTGQFEIIYSCDRPIQPLPWLGVEQVQFDTSEVVMEMLAEVSRGVHHTWQLEQKSRELEAAKKQLQREIIQREHVEAVLRDSEAQLHALLTAITDVVLVLDSQGRYLQIAPTNLALLHQPPDRLIGKTLHEVFPQALADTFLARIRQALETQQTLNIEYSHSTLEKTEVWFASSISPLGKDSVIWVARDITERKHSEETLRQQKEILQTIFDHIPIMVVFFNTEGQMQLLNREVERVLGWPIAEVGTFDLLAECYPDLEYRQNVLDFMLAATGEWQEFKTRTQDGQILDTCWTNIRLSDGTSLGIGQDITERKKTEEARRRAESQYRSIFENTYEGLFQMTPEGRLLRANPGLARIYGYESSEELITCLTYLDRQRYVDKSRWDEFLRRMQTDEKVSAFESQVYRKDGEIIWISENAHVVRSADGELLYYEGSIVDITKRKVWEEALRYQQECTEELLLNILPAPIAHRLKLAESTIADSFSDVTVLFADLVNFTEFSAQIPAPKLVKLLNEIFSKFDFLAEKHGLEKIKTIGDAYMVVGGLPTPKPDHVEAIAEMALDMQREIDRFKGHDGEPFRLRIGIHTGSVVAGVIGTKKFAYDLWGDTVNIASRMESHGVAGRIQVTAATYERLKNKYLFEQRGATSIKGKGEMITYWLIARKVADSPDLG
jgi:urea transport system substrate-binding protein